MKYKKIMIALAAAAALSAAGCGSSSKDTVEVTPTPVPTAAPTAAPATSTPLPTSTPAPKLIGVKTSTAKFVYLTNSTKGEIREIYLRAAGGTEWGKNLGSCGIYHQRCRAGTDVLHAGFCHRCNL